MSNKPPDGNWRKFDKLKIAYTILVQRWKLNGCRSDKFCDIKHFMPLGMQQYGIKLYKDVKCFRTFGVLPQVVKETFKITNENFDKSKFEVEVIATTSNKSKLLLLNRVYCSYCQLNVLPKLLEKYQEYIEDRDITLQDLLDNWDKWKVNNQYSDVVGCFIYLQADVHAGPGARRFIHRPIEHPSSAHPATVNKEKKKQKKNISKDLELTKVVVPQKRKADEPGQCTLTMKHQKKMHFVDIGKQLQSKVVLSAPSSNSNNEFAKGYCLSVVQEGVNKCLSQQAILHMYQVGLNGMKWWHEYLMSSNAVSIDGGKKISPPLEVAVNKNNIIKVEETLLNTYRYDTPDSLYDVARKSPFWSFMHDGISKFGNNLNGFYVRVIDQDYNPVYVPWGLPKVPGSLNTTALGAELVEDIARFTLDGKTNGWTQVSNYFSDDLLIPPAYMKMTTLREVDKDSKIIKLVVDNWPVLNCGDGVAVNRSAAVFVTNKYGLPSPSARCSVHASDGTLKRLAKSETMSVVEIATLYDNLRSIVKNFHFSIKNKEILDDAMSMLSLTLIKLINWGGTRMAHFLVACMTID